MINIASDKKLCRVHCPNGNYTYKTYGTLIECEHGALFVVAVPHVQWATRYWSGNFERLSPFWTPIKWRRANAALAVGGETDGCAV